MTRLAFMVLLLASLGAGARDLPKTVREALASAGVPASAVGVVVAPAQGGPRLISVRADAAMNPASVLKLITSYAALDLLGPAFTFHTDVLLDGKLEGGVLKGNLVFRGGGDPGLTYERLWQLAHGLRARGLREIRGDVIVDRGYFAPAPYDAGEFDHEPRRAYNVGPDALLVNFDAVDFRFIPGAEGVQVTGEPDLPNVEIASHIRSVDGDCGAWRHDLHYDIEDNGLVATAVFSGSYPRACGERTWPLSVFDGPRFFESLFRWIWSEAGGTLRGSVRSGATPPGAQPFLRHESEPLANLVRDMNKYSNNVMARHLFLALSAERLGGSAQLPASGRVVRDWLAARGIDASGLVLDNGSGLSREARVSASMLAAVLASAWSGPLMPELAASLPVFAVDGTLKDHHAPGAAGMAHLKGGTLTGVQSIAGYVLDRRGRRWIVVMMVNHPNANNAEPALDALVAWVSALGAPRAAGGGG
jgi:D-alanyl-D-alanine carboxypeptidase/D-alanyl-D-alanine-endopeptidase (penicillin-binding protein 4)